MTYVLFPDEGHGFARPENNIAFLAVAEHFLSRNLGGLAEAYGDDVKGARRWSCPTAPPIAPGLTEAMPA